jgi:hypothetical protein
MKKCFTAGLTVIFSMSAWAVIVPDPVHMNVFGGFIYNHGIVNPGDLGLTFTNAGVRDITVSAGQLSGVDPGTGLIITNSANLLPLKTQSVDSSTDIYAASNIVAGGSFIGNGSGLTNLDANMISSGSISAGRLPISGNWNAGTLTISNLTVTGLTGDGSGLSGVNAAGISGVDSGKILTSDRSYQSVISNGVVTFKPLLPKEGMVQWLEGVSGNEWIDRKGAMNAQLTGSYCGTFDNVNDYVEVSKQSAANKTYVFLIYFPQIQIFNETNGMALCGGVAGYADDTLAFDRVGDNMRCCIRGGGTNYTTQYYFTGSWLNSMFSGQWRTVVARKSLDDNKFCINIGLISATYSPSSCPITRATGVSKIGYANIGGVYSGDMGSSLALFAEYNRYLSDQEVTDIVTAFNLPANAARILPFSEGAGTTIYDVSGNGNNGTLVNASEQTFWGSTQDQFHYNLLNGFSKISNMYIPALANQSGADALGAVLSSPAGNGHNGAETKIVQSATNNALKATDTAHFWYAADGTPNAVSYADLVALDSARIFANTSAAGLIRSILTYSADLNGSFFDQAQGYIGDTEKQVMMYAKDGFDFIGGSIRGDGSGLTNLNLEAYAGNNLAWTNGQLIAQPGYTDANAVAAVNAAYPNLGAGVNASEVVAIVSSNGFATTSALAALTAADVGAYTTNETCAAINAALAGVQTNGPFIATYIPPQGDLDMGSYTNGLPQ